MGAMPVHHTATTDEPWDGPATVAAMPAEADVLKYCHAWFDSAGGVNDGDDGSDGDKDADGNKKSLFKFPHHKAKGGPANLAACRNGLARLDSADIPDGDRDGVKAHLQAHLDDAGKKESTNMFVPIVEALRAAEPRMQARQNQPWFQIRNAATDTAEVMLYGEVGGWFGADAEDFATQIRDITASNITLAVNSPGGSVFDGLAIANALRAHPANVTVRVDGLAASIASVIAMAGDKVVMMPGAQMMIHLASTLAVGTADDMRDMADLLDLQSANIADVYAAKAGGTREQWLDRMEDESWYLADEAVAAGLADEVAGKPGKDDDDEDEPDGDEPDDAPDAAPDAAPDKPDTPDGDDPDEDDDKPKKPGPAMPAAAWDLSVFRYAGREAAPAPRAAAAVPVPPTDPETAPTVTDWTAFAARITAPPSADDAFTRLKEALK